MHKAGQGARKGDTVAGLAGGSVPGSPRSLRLAEPDGSQPVRCINQRVQKGTRQLTCYYKSPHYGVLAQSNQCACMSPKDPRCH
eukprot:2475060-Pyramimonas_sp.AAC.1